MRILHIAPFNTAGVPLTLVKAERELGHESRLITLGKSSQGREEDICLDLPFIDSWTTRWIKRMATPKSRRILMFDVEVPDQIPILWSAGSILEKGLIAFREWIWAKRIQQILKEIEINRFNMIELDGGLGFFRDGRIIRQFKSEGKKIICLYTGSDLRTRGVIPQIDAISDLNLTVEFDHLRFHPNIHYVPFPLNVSQFKIHSEHGNQILQIGHAPTNRAAKGSDIIIPIVKELEKEFPVQLVLIEGMSYSEALEAKRSCDVFIDQIGNLGYGINSLEALAMGIPTCTSLAPDFEKAYPDHPFVEIREENLKEQIVRLIRNPGLQKRIGNKGRIWVKKVHNAKTVAQRIHHLTALSKPSKTK
jgi:glycosyltransferase involved in cell wall biosynthesis